MEENKNPFFCPECKLDLINASGVVNHFEANHKPKYLPYFVACTRCGFTWDAARNSIHECGHGNFIKIEPHKVERNATEITYHQWLVGMAMQGLLIRGGYDLPDLVAHDAIQQADAVIKKLSEDA